MRIKMSKQSQAEENKTISITEVLELSFMVLKPNKRLIEIVNKADNGRVCTLRVSDFRSKGDAEVYAELIRLAPELLNEYLSNTKTLEQVVGRLEKRVAKMKRKTQKK